MCRVTQVVPDEPKPFQVAGVTGSVIVTISDGEWFACQGACPHENAAFVEGLVQQKMIVCGVHFYAFDLRSGRCTHDPKLTLRRYPITIIGDEVWIELP